MKVKVLKILILCFVAIVIFTNTLVIANDSSSEKLTIDQAREAFREVAYSYYMRGKTTQYNTRKVAYHSPEESTSQKTNYMVCSGLTRNTYRDLLGITIPQVTASLIKYGKDNIGSPEVVAYGYKNEDNDMIMSFYDKKSPNNIKKVKNPKLEDIIKVVQIGDVLTYTGHTLEVYDLVYDDSGNVVDAVLIQSGHGSGKTVVNAKFQKAQTLKDGTKVGSANMYLYLNHKENTNFDYGLEEGSLNLCYLSTYGNWVKIETKDMCDEYSILRFMHEDENGNVVLKYKTLYPTSQNDIDNDEIIELSDKTKDRLKYSKLYIEKTVDAWAEDTVSEGDILTYSIVVKNNSDKAYSSDINVIEKLSPYVTFISDETGKNYNFAQSGNTLSWNIGKLKSKAQIVIKYKVNVNEGTNGKIIESTGFVENIPSSIVNNLVGKRLDKEMREDLSNSFESLKDKYSGSKLINEIYKDALNVDIKFDDFDITNLINNKDVTSNSRGTIGIKNGTFSKAVLNKYWGTLAIRNHTYIEENDFVEYAIKAFYEYGKKDRRADTINPENFMTGDILIYRNHDDNKYTISKNKITKTPVTYENGDYYFIYIEGKGFIGVNYGDDNTKNTNDDRNEFTSKYYADNNLKLLLNPADTDEEFLEYANYQTLIGKDYYVILRPALIYDFEESYNQNKVSYTVNHYKMNTSGKYGKTPDEVETLTADAGSRVSPVTKSYKGFKSPNIQEVTVAENGNTVVNYYYERNKLSISININGGKLAEKIGDGFTVDSEGFIYRNNKKVLQTLYYEGKTSSTGLIDCNNSNVLNTTKDGSWGVLPNKAYNTKADGSGKYYSQSNVYNTSDFMDVSSENKTIILYIQWVHGEDVDWMQDETLNIQEIDATRVASYIKTKDENLKNKYEENYIPYGGFEGMTVSDKYIVIAVISSNTDNTNIVIVDKNTYKILNVDSSHCFVHANGLTYDRNHDIYYSTCGGLKGKNYIAEFKINDKFELENVKLHEVKRAYIGVAYNYDNNKLYTLAQDVLYKLDDSFKEEESFAVKSTKLVKQDISYHDGIIYYSQFEGGKLGTYQPKTYNSKEKGSNLILCLDVKTGELIKSLYISNKTFNGELEDMDIDKDGNMFLTYNHSSGKNVMGSILASDYYKGEFPDFPEVPELPDDPELPEEPDLPDDPNLIDEQKEHIHELIKIAKVEATTKKEGNIEYYKCEKCGKLFKDSKANKEITEKDTIIPKKEVSNNTGGGGGGASRSKSYKITTKTNNGKITPSNPKIEEGEDAKFKFTPNKGYEVSNVIVDGDSVGAVEEYTIENVNEKHTIEVVIEVEKEWTKASTWAVEELKKVQSKKLIPDTIKKQDFTKNITRKDFAAVSVKLYESISKKTAKVAKNNPFNDTEDEYVLKAYNLGITNGTSDNTFSPENELTREQMATMLFRTINKAGRKTNYDKKKVQLFEDDDKISDWSKEAVYYMASKGIIKGVGDNKFGVKNNSTIEQSLLISLRSIENN